MSQGLTVSAIFNAMSLNYGESLGNISELKKLSSGGNSYSYLSRQAIRYELYRCLTENFGMDQGLESPLGVEQKVVQFKPDTSATKYVEADLFGYMKTDKGKGSIIRPAVVRLTPAIALEPFLNDMEFGTNKNFADRTKKDPDPFQFEHHYSLYTYTMTIDLDRIGKDENDGSEVSPEEKYRRVSMVLDAVQLLNREIKGRTESLNPLFVIGGVYPVKNPFFLGKLKAKNNTDRTGYKICVEPLTSILAFEYSLNGSFHKVVERTNIGFIEGYWTNENELRVLIPNQKDTSLNAFFDYLKAGVKSYYGVA
jgi:CRISPR-associated protein Cst2